MNAYILIALLVLYAATIGYIVRDQARQCLPDVEAVIGETAANTRLFKIVVELLTAFLQVLAGLLLLLAAIAMLMLARGMFAGVGKSDSVILLILPAIISFASHCLGILGLAKIQAFLTLALRRAWQRDAETS